MAVYASEATPVNSKSLKRLQSNIVTALVGRKQQRNVALAMTTFTRDCDPGFIILLRRVMGWRLRLIDHP
eukprot:7821491-Alexandrium_andersonii.AAC.1